MKKNEVTIGGTYLAKVTDRVVPVRLDLEHPSGGWHATNLVTNKKIRIKSAQRLRGPAQRTSEPADETTAQAVKPAPTAKPKRLSLIAAAIEVLSEGGAPMNCKQMVDAITSRGLWSTKAPTPHATLYSAILREIQKRGDDARFRKADRGTFELTKAGIEAACVAVAPY